jgi:hypothetical protein
MTDKIVHIARSEKETDIPSIDDATKCDREDCDPDMQWEVNYGLAGGGMGVYQYCKLCERVVGKDLDRPEEM